MHTPPDLRRGNGYYNSQETRYGVKNEFCDLQFTLPTKEDFQELFDQVLEDLKKIPPNEYNRMPLSNLILQEVQRRLAYKIDLSVRPIFTDCQQTMTGKPEEK
jgi:hypothetical protein